MLEAYLNDEYIGMIDGYKIFVSATVHLGVRYGKRHIDPAEREDNRLTSCEVVLDWYYGIDDNDNLVENPVPKQVVVDYIVGDAVELFEYKIAEFEGE